MRVRTVRGEAQKHVWVQIDPRPAHVYIDPPYQGTTPYAHDLTRAWCDVCASVGRAAASAAMQQPEVYPLPEVPVAEWEEP